MFLHGNWVVEVHSAGKLGISLGACPHNSYTTAEVLKSSQMLRQVP